MKLTRRQIALGLLALMGGAGGWAALWAPADPIVGQWEAAFGLERWIAFYPDGRCRIRNALTGTEQVRRWTHLPEASNGLDPQGPGTRLPLETEARPVAPGVRAYQLDNGRRYELQGDRLKRIAEREPRSAPAYHSPYRRKETWWQSWRRRLEGWLNP